MACSFNKFYKIWSIAISVVNLIGLTLTLFYQTNYAWITMIAMLFGIYMLKIRDYLPNFPMLIGYANWVSFFRLVMVVALFAYYPILTGYQLFSFFLLAISLDGVDGYLARRFGHSSEAGEILDMEVDAFLVLALSWIHVSQMNLHWFILIPGGLRYIYELFLFWKPKNNVEILPKRLRSIIAVFFFLSLLIPFVTILPNYIFATYISGGLIICSFAISFYGQFKNSDS